MSAAALLSGTGTIAAALAYAEAQLQRGAAAFDAPDELRSEAHALLRFAAGLSAARIFADPQHVLDAAAWARLRQAVQRRSAGEPLAYIEGMRGFHAIELAVDSNVLVPRPETELIVDAVLERAPTSDFALVDLGTGSGAIALAVAHARAKARVVGVDRSAAALEVARGNAERLGLNVEWIESDWFAALGDRRFDFICCNPPYIRSSDPHLAQLRHEPLRALDGGADGLADIRRVFAGAAQHLRPGGSLLLEHGFDQAAEVAVIAAAAGMQRAQSLRDLAGHERAGLFTVGQ